MATIFHRRHTYTIQMNNSYIKTLKTNRVSQKITQRKFFWVIDILSYLPWRIGMNDMAKFPPNYISCIRSLIQHFYICFMPATRDTKIDGLKEEFSDSTGPVNLYY